METRRSSAIEQAVLLGLISAYVLVAGGVIALPRHLPKQAPTEVVLGLLAGLAVHELAHALAAVLLGDDTPRREGRLTLNPLAHLHPVGTLLILGIGVGWARPVAFDPTALRARKWGVAIVKAAGPVANLLLGILLVWVGPVPVPFAGGWPESTLGRPYLDLEQAAFPNLMLFAMNLIPVAPLDGAAVFEAMVFRDPPGHQVEPSFWGVLPAVLLALLVFLGAFSRLAALLVLLLSVLFVVLLQILVVVRLAYSAGRILLRSMARIRYVRYRLCNFSMGPASERSGRDSRSRGET